MHFSKKIIGLIVLMVSMNAQAGLLSSVVWKSWFSNPVVEAATQTITENALPQVGEAVATQLIEQGSTASTLATPVVSETLPVIAQKSPGITRLVWQAAKSGASWAYAPVNNHIINPIVSYTIAKGKPVVDACDITFNPVKLPFQFAKLCWDNKGKTVIATTILSLSSYILYTKYNEWFKQQKKKRKKLYKYIAALSRLQNPQHTLDNEIKEIKTSLFTTDKTLKTLIDLFKIEIGKTGINRNSNKCEELRKALAEHLLGYDPQKFNRIIPSHGGSVQVLPQAHAVQAGIQNWNINL